MQHGLEIPPNAFENLHIVEATSFLAGLQVGPWEWFRRKEENWRTQRTTLKGKYSLYISSHHHTIPAQSKYLNLISGNMF